jgi:hypothetical protein
MISDAMLFIYLKGHFVWVISSIRDWRQRSPQCVDDFSICFRPQRTLRCIVELIAQFTVKPNNSTRILRCLAQRELTRFGKRQ